MTEYEELSEKLEQAGLSRWSEYLLQLAKPSIRIHSQAVEEDNLPIGISKFGGSMDLPADVDWPTYKGRPLWPMAQFWMPDVAPYDTEGVLPHSGMMYFFYDMVEQPWGYDPSHRDGWKVIYHDIERTQLNRVLPQLPMPDYDILDLSVCALDFTAEIALPPAWADEISDVLAEEDIDPYWDLLETLGDKSSVHKLLGYPNQTQGDMAIEAQLVSNGLYMGGPTDLDDPDVKRLLEGRRTGGCYFKWMMMSIVSSDSVEMVQGYITGYEKKIFQDVTLIMFGWLISVPNFRRNKHGHNRLRRHGRAIPPYRPRRI